MAQQQEVFSPAALDVDPQPLNALSDGNAVFEAGERVVVAPAWRNEGAFAQHLDGTASGFSGPAGPDYTLVAEEAVYGEVGPGATASCQESGMCYEAEIVPAGGERPAAHWDAAFDEALSDQTTTTWTLHMGESFADVPRDHLFYRAIETALHHGVALDCGGGNYCPGLPETRAMMAMTVLVVLQGADFTPEPCEQGQEAFADVPFDDPFCPWIEELFERGVVAGCGDGVYCPEAPVTRAQMAVFLLRTLLGSGYEPPACANAFADVACPSLFADWIEELFARGITAGCAAGAYCPGSPVSRGQMAVFVARTFGLTLYGP